MKSFDSEHVPVDAKRAKIKREKGLLPLVPSPSVSFATSNWQPEVSREEREEQFRGIKETLRGVQNRETYIYTCARVAFDQWPTFIFRSLLFRQWLPLALVPLSNSLITPREFDKNLNSTRDTGCSGSESTIRSPRDKLFHNRGLDRFFQTGLFDFSQILKIQWPIHVVARWSKLDRIGCDRQILYCCKIKLTFLL